MKITKIKKNAGFEFIELMVVMAIIGVIFLMLLSSVANAKKQAQLKAQQAKTPITQIGQITGVVTDKRTVTDATTGKQSFIVSIVQTNSYAVDTFVYDQSNVGSSATINVAK